MRVVLTHQLCGYFLQQQQETNPVGLLYGLLTPKLWTVLPSMDKTLLSPLLSLSFFLQIPVVLVLAPQWDRELVQGSDGLVPCGVQVLGTVLSALPVSPCFILTRIPWSSPYRGGDWGSERWRVTALSEGRSQGPDLGSLCSRALRSCAVLIINPFRN